MPPRRGDPQRPQHTFALPNDLWDELAAEAVRAGYANRTELLDAFARWYTRRPGARAVKRPPAS